MSEATQLQHKSKFELIFTYFIAILCIISFGFITVMSLIQTSVIDPEKYNSEHILFKLDYFYLNLIVLLLFSIIIFNLNKLYNLFARINIKFMYAGMTIYTVTIGLIWVFSVLQIPGADSANIFETATEVIKNDFSSLKNGTEFYNASYYNNISYYNFYPFQLGFVLISELVYRIFGTDNSIPLQILNVICVTVAYCGIARISKIVFKRKSIEFFTIILLIGCLQPIIFCTFPYGNIIGMCFSIWATYFLIKYIQTNKWFFIIPTILLTIIAVTAKYNNMIYLVAFSVILVIHTIRDKKMKSIAFALLLCFTVILSNNLVIMSYEKRANVKIEEGVSQILYLDMGLNESYMAPGWYGGKFMGYYKNSNCNIEVAEALAKQDISQRINKFKSDPIYTFKFFSQKILSQWNEPTYECVWVSKTKKHLKEPNALVNSVYEGNTGECLEMYFNQYMQLLFLLFTAGIICLIVRKKLRIETILLPLILMGAFGYHLLFEGKSQYLAVYIILLIPTASFAIHTIFYKSYDKINNIILKLKTAHETKE